MEVLISPEYVDWKPLKDALPPELDPADWMWMHATRAPDGGLIHSYKHTHTRRYLHLDRRRQIYTFGPDGPIAIPGPPQIMLRLTLLHHQPPPPSEPPAVDLPGPNVDDSEPGLGL